MNKATVYIVILGLVCTLLGIAVGIGIEKKYTTRNFPRLAREQFLRHHHGLVGHQQARKDFGARAYQKGKQKFGQGNAFERMGEELNLSQAQQEKLQSILQSNREEIKQARDAFRADIEELVQKSRAQILEVLDPEQQEKFEQLIERAEQRRQSKAKGGPFGFQRERQ